jgi:hypothetical protein
VKRPTGVTIIAVLTFCGAAILALGSFGFFFIAVMGMSGGDVGQPTSVAIAGMGIAGGCSLLILASVTVGLAIGVLKLREWAWIVSIASNAVGIGCTIRFQGVSCASACPVDRFSFACGVDGRVDARVPLDPPSQAGF